MERPKNLYAGEAISQRVGVARLSEIAGNLALTGFQAPKVLWLREVEPHLYMRVASLLLPKDYIGLRLTGERATDASDASGTLLLGGLLRWLRDLIGRGYDQLSDLAADSPPGAEGLVFLPYLTGERTPYLDPLARGAFFGLTSRHGLSHLTRAVMEGVAFSLRDSLEIISSVSASPTEIRASGGGARSAFWRQLLADILGHPIVRTAADEGPAYGAALLGGVARRCIQGRG